MVFDASHSKVVNNFDAFTDGLVEQLTPDQRQVVLDGLALKFCEAVTAPGETGTPIDTGRARAGWARGLEGLGGKFARRGADSKAITEGRRRGGLRHSVGKKKGHLGYVAITNNVSYIQYLEYGSSDQAPSGMIRINLEKMRVGTRKAAQADIRGVLAVANAKARAMGKVWKAAS